MAPRQRTSVFPEARPSHVGGDSNHRTAGNRVNMPKLRKDDGRVEVLDAPLGPTLTVTEFAADKTLALFYGGGSGI